MAIQNNQMPRITGHGFQTVPGPELQRSTFDRSHERKGTMLNSGYLIPIYRDEVLPGDHFQLSCTSFLRLATGLTPFMDNLYLDVHFWYVRNRLLWSNWPKFLGEQANPGDSIDYLIPQVTIPSGGVAYQSLSDNLGIRPGVAGGKTVSALYHRAYNFIYNLAYRDQNLQDSVAQDNGDGPDLESDYVLLRRGKRHDYFTSCLPWPQKGDAVTLPLGGEASVYGTENTAMMMQHKNVDADRGTINKSVTGDTAELVYNSQAGSTSFTGDLQLVSKTAGVASGVYADLTTATANTINSLREAFTLQQFLERDARGGTRQNEIIKAHFGVTVPDSYYRPEYIGGGTVPLKTFVIPQTSGTGSSGTPQANLASYSTAAHSGVGFSHSFDEHGVVLGLISVRAPYTYQQGLPREFSRKTRYDFYWPTFANIGEQAVLNKEIYFQGTTADDGVFGYQEAWAEYRYKPSEITGQFRSDFAQTLDSWHLAQNFTALPTLSPSFIEENPPVDRVIAVESESGFPQFLMDFAFNLKCTRAMPIFGVPGLHRM